MSPYPILPLLWTVFESILEVFLLCIAGYVLARQGILDKEMQRKVNRLNISLFTPSLLFVKIAFFLTAEKLQELWIIPLVFVITTVVSMTVAYLFGTILRIKKSQRNFAMAAAMFMNSNTLPIALMQSLVYSVTALKWDDDDTGDAMLGRALTYLVLYSSLGMMLRWSFGVRLLASADEEQQPIHEREQHRPAATERTPLISSRPASMHSRTSTPPPPILVHPTSSSSSLDSIMSSESSTDADAENTLTLPKPLSQTNSRPLPTRAQTARSIGITHQHYFYSFPNLASGPPSPTASVVSLVAPEPEAWHKRFATGFWEFMTPPMWASVLSLVVACAAPLQHFLEAHVSPVKMALTKAGDCSIPLTLVVLGAYFYTPPGEAERAEQRDAMDRRSGEKRTVLAAVASRMFLTPLVLLPLMAILIKGDVHQIFDDPVFVVSNVLLITSPPALTLAQITQAASGDAFERLISRTVFWAYCVVTPLSTMAAVLGGLVMARL